jgi:hypothetical protein
VEEDVGVDLSAGVVCIHNRQVDDCVADDEEILIEGGQVDVLAEEVEEDVGVDLLAGVVCKKYKEPESCRSTADYRRAALSPNRNSPFPSWEQRALRREHQKRHN